MKEDQNQLIYSFPRGKGEEIQISLRTYKDRRYIDLRQWFQAKNESELRPTKKGVYFSIDSIEELRKGIIRLSEAIKRLPSEECLEL